MDEVGQAGICRRLAELRLVVFGRRGRAKLAQAINVSPSTYNYYEKNRPPPAEVIARVAKVTGASVAWLVCGKGAMFEGEAKPPIAEPVGQAPGLLDRLGTLLKAAPRLEQPVSAFVMMLEEMAGVSRLEAAAAGAQEGLIPIIGGTAAGVARFWGEALPLGSGRPEGETTLADRVREVLGRGLSAARQAAELAADRAEPPGPSVAPAPAVPQTVSLVQLSEPDGRGVLEFLDCPGVRDRVRDPFGLRVDGDSMVPRYYDGDIVLVSPDFPAEEGRPAIVKLRDQIGATCKVYAPCGDRLHLVPVNEKYPATEHALAHVEWALAVLWRVVVR